MHIPIPIPIGAKHVAAVQGAVWKFVSCAHCQQRYAYLVQLEATGEDHDLLFLDGEGATERARTKAEQNLLQKSRNVVIPVPCPACGCYQEDMTQKLKEEVSINPLQIAGAVIAVISLVPLALGIPYIWVLTVVLALSGLALVTWGYVRAFRYDPNAGDPEPRKALGRSHAVWGEQLAELLATNQPGGKTPLEQHDAFRGSPWNVKPTEEWNRPAYWAAFYRDLLAKPDSWERGQAAHRDVDLLIRMLTQAGELPRSSPLTLLDAGCGIALIPHVLAFWGFQVTAVDASPAAIEVASTHRPGEEELALCVPIWDPCADMPGVRQLVEEPARSLQRLRSFRAPGGSVTFLTADWFTPQLRPGTFGVVHCRNSLRCATKPYWRRSLQRFHELLAPGGVLLLENVNAIGIQNEVEELLAEGGFVPLPSKAAREMSAKYVIAMWPTG